MAVEKVTRAMKIIKEISTLKSVINQNCEERKSIGFVPTMGFLHDGHLALVHQAKTENDLVVMSIFVNPTQFGPGEDYETYPRNEKRDIKLAEEAGVDLLFMPNCKEMYPRPSTIQIIPGLQARMLCGATRPGHFDGVLKIVLKLFNLVDPDYAYFGMKDAQQLAIIESFVEDFNLPTTIRRIPTVRELDGLAKSSRNVKLRPKERLEAPIILTALKIGRKKFYENWSVQTIEQEVARQITENSSGIIDYVSLLDYPALTPITEGTQEVILACAVKFEQTRLIDNLIFSTKG